ncbi:Uncharacterised protein [Vibrio cholerae]|nr:Uncharacterised protein [Vibrio cholerae]
MPISLRAIFLAITVRKTVIYISLLRQGNTNKLRSYCPIMSPVKC